VAKRVFLNKVGNKTIDAPNFCRSCIQVVNAVIDHYTLQLEAGPCGAMKLNDLFMLTYGRIRRRNGPAKHSDGSFG
jgi:hypothetical protein